MDIWVISDNVNLSQRIIPQSWGIDQRVTWLCESGVIPFPVCGAVKLKKTRGGKNKILIFNQVSNGNE